MYIFCCSFSALHLLWTINKMPSFIFLIVLSFFAIVSTSTDIDKKFRTHVFHSFYFFSNNTNGVSLLGNFTCWGCVKCYWLHYLEARSSMGAPLVLNCCKHVCHWVELKSHAKLCWLLPSMLNSTELLCMFSIIVWFDLSVKFWSAFGVQK